MTGPLEDQVLRKIGEVCSLYHRLILMVGQAGSGKTLVRLASSVKRREGKDAGLRTHDAKTPSAGIEDLGGNAVGALSSIAQMEVVG